MLWYRRRAQPKKVTADATLPITTHAASAAGRSSLRRETWSKKSKTLIKLRLIKG
jgi:hypothetical protein